jgi:FKBP-type peptidyl-prolyl cis-trans isomerase
MVLAAPVLFGGITAVNFTRDMGSFLLTDSASAQELPGYKNRRDMESYAMGVEFMKNLKRQGVDFNFDILMKGMRDAQAGGKLLMTEAEISTSLRMAQSDIKRKTGIDRRVAEQDNKKNGEAFLAENKTKEGVVTLPSGLQYKILKKGDGRKPTEGDTVECLLRGTRIDGTEFYSMQPTVFKVSDAIPGWREALKLMPVGSMWQLFIPSQLAYAQRGSGKIGPYETVIYEIDLVGIK